MDFKDAKGIELTIFSNALWDYRCKKKAEYGVVQTVKQHHEIRKIENLLRQVRDEQEEREAATQEELVELGFDKENKQ